MMHMLQESLLDDAVHRAEQSRHSYNVQTEEFRHLNANLQSYLDEIKTIDDENRRVQETIEAVRANYVATLEHHLIRLPENFRQQSQTLTQAHVERYKSKSRARRLNSEREELKRRIHFVARNEKDQLKRLSALQKQERLVQNEFRQLSAHIESLIRSVENEKQLHRQAMVKVDHLQLQLEQVCVERSKTEFEIQSLKEEVQLMQTAREFLDEERETLLSTQTEANEYLLSRLNESIQRIRDDFAQLNRTQLEQLEIDYQQQMQILENTLFTSSDASDATSASTDSQTANRLQVEQLESEHRTVSQELSIVNKHNQSLSERVMSMETDLYSIRDDRMRQLISKDQQLERSKLELQTLSEQLTHLAEYDRNLKFELTLYRGVLESEYRRKQQQSAATRNPTQLLVRPTTSPSNKNFATESPTSFPITIHQHQSTDSVQQDEAEILASRIRVQSDYDPLGDTIQTSFEERKSTREERDLLSSSQHEHEIGISTEFSYSSQRAVYVGTGSVPLSFRTPLTKNDVSSSILEVEEVSPTSSPASEDLSHPVDHTTDALLIREQPIAYTEPTVFSPRSEVIIEVQVPSSRSSSTSQDTVHELPESAPSTVPVEQPVSSSLIEENLSSPSMTKETVNDPLPALTSTFPEEQWTSSPQLRTLPFIPSETATASTALIADEVFPSSPPASPVRLSTVHEDDKADSTVSTTSSSTDQATSSFNPQSPNLSPEVRKLPSAPIFEAVAASSFSSPSDTSTADQPASISRQISSKSSPSSRTSSISSDMVTEVGGFPLSTLATAMLSEPQKTTEITPTASSVADSSSQVTDLVAQSTSLADNDHQTVNSSVTEKMTPALSDIKSEIPLISASVGQPVSTERDTTEPVSGGDPLAQSLELESSILEELEISFDTKPSQSRSSSAYDLTSPLPDQRERIESGESDTHLSSSKDAQPTIQIDDSFSSTRREEEEGGVPSHSSSSEPIEEGRPTNLLSSIVIKEYPSSDYPNELRPSPVPDSGRQSSHDSSLTDVEEMTTQTSPNLDSKISDEDQDPALASIMQDLRYVFHEFANEEDLVEINSDLPDKLLDRLEFRDHLIRTLFDSLLRKYLVQAAAQATRSKTLDWLEFRDILFPIITGRYTERHIRKLFDLFDTTKDGHLSLQEIAELLEILQANDTIDLAQNIIDEYDTDHDGKLSADEFIEAIKKTDDINDNVLSEETETKQWFSQSPVENATALLEDPTFDAATEKRMGEHVLFIAEVFRNVGADRESKRLDSHREDLAKKITDEFAKINISISRADLESFIQLFLAKKQHTDSLIDWAAFRDTFFAIAQDEFYSNNDVERWFDVFDENADGRISTDKALHLLRLLQISDPEVTLSKVKPTVEAPNDVDTAWTLDEILLALEKTLETALRAVSTFRKFKLTTRFDEDWLANGVF